MENINIDGLRLTIIGVFFSLISTSLYGYCLSYYWQWFIMPTFSLPKLSIPVAMGIGLAIQLSHVKYEDNVSKDAIFL